MLKLQKQLQNSSRLNPFDWIQLKLWCTFKYSSENVSPFSMLVSLEFYIFLRTNSNVSIFPIKFDPNWQKAYLVFTLVQGLGQSIWRPLLPLAPVDSNRDCIAPIFYSFFYETPNKPKTPMNFNCLFVSIRFDSIEFWSILFTFIVRFKVDKSLSFFYVLLFLCFFGVYINYIAFDECECEYVSIIFVWIDFVFDSTARIQIWVRNLTINNTYILAHAHAYKPHFHITDSLLSPATHIYKENKHCVIAFKKNKWSTVITLM